jgi:hypothetical protein
LTKVGENITDKTEQLARSLWQTLQHKLPNSQTVKAIRAGQEIDYQQAVIDVEAIASDTSNPDVAKLLDEVRSLLSNNKELALKIEKVEKTVAKSQQKNMQLNRDNSQGYQFNNKVEASIIGGNHTHIYGTKSD